MSPRCLELWLSDIAGDPETVASCFPLEPAMVRHKDRASGHAGRPALRSVVVFRQAFTDREAWDVVVDAFVSALGGWDSLKGTLETCGAHEVVFQFNLPIYGSPNQENNGLEPETLRKLAGLDVGVGFEFGDYEQP